MNPVGSSNSSSSGDLNIPIDPAIYGDSIGPARDGSSIVSYAQEMATENSEFRQTQYAIAQSQLLFLQGIFAAIGLNVTAQIESLKKAITDAYNAWKPIYDATNTMKQDIVLYNSQTNSSVNNLNKTVAYNDWQDFKDQYTQMVQDTSAYKSSMQSAVDDLYSAIDTYNQSSGTTNDKTTLTNAINLYKTIVTGPGGTSGLNGAYQAQVDAYNAKVNYLPTLNNEFADAGLPIITPSPSQAPNALSIASGTFAPPSLPLQAPPLAATVPSVAQQSQFLAYASSPGVADPPSISPQTTNLSTAISQYNISRASANALYQSQLDSYRAVRNTVPDTNNLLALAGIPPIVQPADASDPIGTTPPSPLAPPSSGGPFPIDLLINPGVSTLINTVTQPPATLTAALNQFMPNLANTVISNYLKTSDRTPLGLNKFLLNYFDSVDPYRGDVTLPDTYVKPQHIPTPAGQDSPGSTGASILHSVGIGSPIFNRILFRTLHDSVTQQLPGTSAHTFDELKLLVFNLLKGIAPQAAASTANQLPLSALEEGNAPDSLDISSALSILTSIQGLVASGVVAQSVQAFLDATPEYEALTSAQKEDLVKALTAQVNLSLLTIGLTQLSFALQLPGLTAHILGNVQGQPPLHEVLAPSEAGNVNRVLENPFSVESLKTSLVANFVAATGVSQSVAENLVNQAIDQVLNQGPFRSVHEFRAAIEKAFQIISLPTPVPTPVPVPTPTPQPSATRAGEAIAKAPVFTPLPTQITPSSPTPAPLPIQGTQAPARLPPSLVSQLTEEIAGIVKNESTLPRLESPFLPGPLQSVFRQLSSTPPPAGVSAQAATSSVLSALPAETSNVFQAGTPQRFFLESLVGETQKNPGVATALNQTLSQTFTSTREFRSSFLSALTASGLIAKEATKIADLTIRALAPSPSPATPLTNPEPTTALPISTITEEIHAAVLPRLQKELGAARANAIADQLSSAVANIVRSYDLQVQVFNEQRLTEANQAFTDSIGSLSHPNIALFALKGVITSEIVKSLVEGYLDPSKLGNLGQDTGGQPLSWRAATVLPV